MSHNRTVSSSVWGFLVGGATGFALGLLLAPNEGREIRRRVAYLLDSWAADLSTLVDRLDDEAQSSDARARADALVEDAREQAAQLLDEADQLISEARRRSSD